MLHSEPLWEKCLCCAVTLQGSAENRCGASAYLKTVALKYTGHRLRVGFVSSVAVSVFHTPTDRTSSGSFRRHLIVVIVDSKI